MIKNFFIELLIIIAGILVLIALFSWLIPVGSPLYYWIINISCSGVWIYYTWSYPQKVYRNNKNR